MHSKFCGVGVKRQGNERQGNEQARLILERLVQRVDHVKEPRSHHYRSHTELSMGGIAFNVNMGHQYPNSARQHGGIMMVISTANAHASADSVGKLKERHVRRFGQAPLVETAHTTRPRLSQHHAQSRLSDIGSCLAATLPFRRNYTHITYRHEPVTRGVVSGGGEVQAARVDCLINCSSDYSVPKGGSSVRSAQGRREAAADNKAGTSKLVLAS